MPFWPCQYTAGVPPKGAIFCPSADTSQIGPIFSVTSIRPSGRKAIRQGSENVDDTVVISNGSVTSGFCSPTLTWAHAAGDARVSSNTAFENLTVIHPSFLRTYSASEVAT